MTKPAAGLAGQRFGKLVALDRTTGKRSVRWRCRCDCGNEKLIRADHLRSGGTLSCGCYRRSKLVTHGHSRRGPHSLARRSPTYSTWRAMRARCSDPNNEHHSYYGGRGIKVCDRWLGADGCANYVVDMGEKPPGLSIDRRDVDGDYTPENCRWATQTEQSRNRRGPTLKLSVDSVQEIHGRCEHGESPGSVAARFGVGKSTVLSIRKGRTWADQLGGPS